MPAPHAPKHVAKELVRMRLDALHEWPGNMKAHDLGAIRESMDANGVYAPIYAQKSTLRIVKGHGTRRTMLDAGLVDGDVILLDVSDAVAERILLADNWTQTRGGYDDGALLAFAERLMREESGLLGTAFDADDVQSLAQQGGMFTADSAPTARTAREQRDRDGLVSYTLRLFGDDRARFRHYLAGRKGRDAANALGALLDAAGVPKTITEEGTANGARDPLD